MDGNTSTYLSSTYGGTQADSGSAIFNMWHPGFCRLVVELQKGRKRKALDGRGFDGQMGEGF